MANITKEQVRSHMERSRNNWRQLYEEERAARMEAQRVVRDTLWMAGRYADGRQTYAVGMYNDALKIAQRGGYDGGAKPAIDGGMSLEPTPLSSPVGSVAPQGDRTLGDGQ